jgi:hypothetical protein
MSRTTNRPAIIAVATVGLYGTMLALRSISAPASAAPSVPCMDMMQGIVTTLAGALPPQAPGVPVGAGPENALPPAVPVVGAPISEAAGSVLPPVAPVVGAPISEAAGSVLPPVAPVVGAPLTTNAANVASLAPPVLGVPIATDIESAAPLAPSVSGVPVATGSASSADILQPIQEAASTVTGFLPLLTAPGLPGVPADTNVASPTSLMPLFPGATSALPDSAPVAEGSGAPAEAVETADMLSGPLSAAVPSLAKGASMLLSPQALDGLCPPGVGLTSAPNLSTAPAVEAPIPAQLVGVVRDPH